MSGMPEATVSSWRQIGGERVVIAGSGEGSNRDGILSLVETGRLFAGWMRDNAIEAVIVRPDRYVFAGAKNADQLNMLIEQLIQNLHAGR
jgi:3-(3-hydroxy-phenyl)propionate hydroxylase